MGIRERQNRERENVRRKILAAARTLFLNEGYINVSMRKVADQIEYSPGAIYSYFANKEDILFALAEEGLQALRVHCEAGLDSGSPLERVREALWRFYTFSRQQPEYFSLVFIDASVPRISRDWERFGAARELKRELEHEIQQCIDTGVFPRASSAPSVLRLLWSVMYGVAAFRLSHRLPATEDADALAHDVLETTLAGLRAGSELRFVAQSDSSDELPPTSGDDAAPHPFV